MEQEGQTEQILTGKKRERMLIIGAILIAVILIGVFVFNSDSQVAREEKKAKMFERINTADTVPLTEEEKLGIINDFGGKNTSKFNFTKEEQEKILRALNSR